MRFLQIVSMATLAALLASCTPTYSYRYRVTVEVNTPQGIRSGSSVWETSATDQSLLGNISTQTRGEAVAVDLLNGTLFALMRGQDFDVNYAAGIVEGHLTKHPEVGAVMGKDWKANRKLIQRTRPSFDLDADEYPLMVRFYDADEPKSVERVDPHDLSKLSSSSAIRRVHIEVTTDRKESRILDRLPWLKTLSGALNKEVCSDLAHQPLPCRVTESDFRQ
jgi:hypothetical protein